MLHFTFLGTSSGVPTRFRNVSGLAIKDRRSKDWLLIDAGEGTQHRIQHAKLSLQHLIAICITHVHGDHCYGLMGILASAGMNGRQQPLSLIAPVEIQAWLAATMRLTDLHLPYPIQFIDASRLSTPHPLNKNLSIQSHVLHHRVPCYAFSINAVQTQRKLNSEALHAIGLPKGELWGVLQQGHAVEWQGRQLDPADFVDATTQTVRAVIGGDNDQPELLSDACQSAQLLIHESTYDQACLDRIGPAHMHSSAKMLAQFAQQQQLPYLILTHFSPRYHNSVGFKLLADEVAAHYQGQFYLADDFDQYHLDANGKLQQLYHRNIEDS